MYDANIHPVALPPNSTSFLQPLDVTVNSVLKTCLKSEGTRKSIMEYNDLVTDDMSEEEMVLIATQCASRKHSMAEKRDAVTKDICSALNGVSSKVIVDGFAKAGMIEAFDEQLKCIV